MLALSALSYDVAVSLPNMSTIPPPIAVARPSINAVIEHPVLMVSPFFFDSVTPILGFPAQPSRLPDVGHRTIHPELSTTRPIST